MPTEAEVRVMRLLSAIELTPATARRIEEMGTEAVTVVCEAALGSYPGIRPKVRTNAVSLLGWMEHPQARETIPLLVNDPNPDVAIRAMRAAGRQKNAAVVEPLGQVLQRPQTTILRAVEAAGALAAIGTPAAREHLSRYEAASPETYPHRASQAVNHLFRTRQRG